MIDRAVLIPAPFLADGVQDIVLPGHSIVEFRADNRIYQCYINPNSGALIVEEREQDELINTTVIRSEKLIEENE